MKLCTFQRLCFLNVSPWGWKASQTYLERLKKIVFWKKDWFLLLAGEGTTGQEGWQLEQDLPALTTEWKQKRETHKVSTSQSLKIEQVMLDIRTIQERISRAKYFAGHKLGCWDFLPHGLPAGCGSVCRFSHHQDRPTRVLSSKTVLQKF